MSSNHYVVTEQITWLVTTTSANTSLYSGMEGADGVAIVSFGRRSHSAQYYTDSISLAVYAHQLSTKYLA
jgi:hypothetical protein